ncbi:cytochrome P450 [Streptomyces paradoxus]|uniref:Cytochrome P450 n=1 Tax=Streptomyces paradoxus TaxID=66375 RepID=A0A7W9THR3_9ACTN|nr:cytochrome P450 [Streptomyces paradoxus]MBB6080963.1 cytochrome P450 [Streptomyces paradoxus]
MSSVQMVEDPVDFYDRLREHGPVVRVHLDGDVPAYLVTGYTEVNQVLKDGLRFTRDLGQWSITPAELPPGWPLRPHTVRRQNMLHAVGEEHVRLRAAFRHSLGKIGRGHLSVIVRTAADQLIDAFVDDGHTDLVSRYALPLPVAALGRMFGFPPEEATRFQRLIPALLGGGEDALDANTELTEIIATHVSRRHADPREDVTTGLVEAGLSADEIEQTLWLSINASVGATTAWTANTLLLLARLEETRGDLRGWLRDIPGVMAEVLWDHAPVQQPIGRIATADVVLNDTSTLIPRGSLVVPSLAGANLDPSFDEMRKASAYEDNASHVAFGNGAHECPAPDEARVIVQGGVERLWTRLPDIYLTQPAQAVEWGDSILTRMPKHLSASWDPAQARHRGETLAHTPTGDR